MLSTVVQWLRGTRVRQRPLLPQSARAVWSAPNLVRPKPPTGDPHAAPRPLRIADRAHDRSGHDPRRRPVGGRLLQGPHHPDDHRRVRGRRLRPAGAARRALHVQAHSGKSQDRPAKHAGRGRPGCGELARERRAARRHGDARDLLQPAGRPGGRSRRRQIRHPQVQLHRQHHRQPQRHQFLAFDRRHQNRAGHGEGVRGRGDRDAAAAPTTTRPR